MMYHPCLWKEARRNAMRDRVMEKLSLLGAGLSEEYWRLLKKEVEPDNSIEEFWEYVAVLKEGGAAYDRFLLRARACMKSGQPLSPRLAHFMEGVLDGTITRRKQGRSPLKNLERDLIVALAVLEAVNQGMKATRNDASEAHNSACDLVSECLTQQGYGLSYAAVKSLWTKSPIKAWCEKQNPEINLTT